MNRVACLASLLLLAASLPAVAGDNDKFKSAVRDAVKSSATREQQPQPRPPQEFKPAVVRAVSNQVPAGAANPSPKPRNHRDDYRYADYCSVYSNCPLGFPGGPTYEELRHRYRNYTDNELWDICMGRRVAPFGYGSQGACVMLGSPDPWRPVDVPHNLERDESAASGETVDALLNMAKKTCEARDEKASAVNETLNRKRPSCGPEPEKAD